MIGPSIRVIVLMATTMALLGLGLFRVWPRLRTFIPFPISDDPVRSSGDYTNIIFLHHSTGRLLIEQGDVRSQLAALGYQFWHHGYNNEGLVLPDGITAPASYGIPGNLGRGNTDVDGLAALFTQPASDPPSNAFSRLLQHEVIVIKSCFPNNAIKSDEMQKRFQAWYLQIREAMDQHPDHTFVIVTTPPLHPLATNADEARRARNIADRIVSEAFLDAHANIFVFDFFDLLADPNTNTLRAGYQLGPDKPDSHPNRLANETIGPKFATFLDQSVRTYKQRRAGNDY